MLKEYISKDTCGMTGVVPFWTNVYQYVCIEH